MWPRHASLAGAGFLLIAGVLPCSAVELDRELDCCNRIDDDGDGRADFDDSDCSMQPECGLYSFHRGDARPNGRIDITDAIQILGFLFAGSTLSCLEAADADDDGQILVTDAILLLTYLFSDGPPPAAPGPPGEPCGFDPKESPSIGCSFYGPCVF